MSEEVLLEKLCELQLQIVYMQNELHNLKMYMLESKLIADNSKQMRREIIAASPMQLRIA